MRARVVGEGGNVGFTQLARVEYALAGGRIDTDAIDNAGGVALSDHEVNFKILLAPLAGSELLPAAERSAVLRACAEPADQAVLAHCASQSRALSLEVLRAQVDPERFSLAAEFLVARAELDPELEHLPPREHARARGWTRPELAVLLGYTKRLCKQALAAGGIPAHPSLAELFKGYFPALLRDRFPHELETHQLRDAITATRVVNHVVDRAGASLVPELARGLGAEVPEVLFAWLSADRLLGAEALRESAAGDTEAVRLRARLAVENAVAQAAALALGLEGRALLEPDDEAKRAAQIAELRERLGQPAPTRCPRWCARSPALRVAERSGAPLARALELWNELGARTRIHWLLDRLARGRARRRLEPALGVGALARDVPHALRAVRARAARRRRPARRPRAQRARARARARGRAGGANRRRLAQFRPASRALAAHPAPVLGSAPERCQSG